MTPGRATKVSPLRKSVLIHQSRRGTRSDKHYRTMHRLALAFCLLLPALASAQPADVKRVLRTFDFEERRLGNKNLAQVFPGRAWIGLLQLIGLA